MTGGGRGIVLLGAGIIILVVVILASKLPSKFQGSNHRSGEGFGALSEIQKTPQNDVAAKALAPKTRDEDQKDTMGQVEPLDLLRQGVHPRAQDLALESEGLVEAALHRLPAKRDLSDFSEHELHFTPPIIVEAGRLLGRWIEGAERDESLQRQTLRFFQKCVAAKDKLTSVRALCFRNLVDHSGKWRIPVDLMESQVEPEILRLAAEIR